MPSKRTYELSIGEYLSWFNKSFNLTLSKVNDFHDGVAFSLFFNEVYPGVLDMKQIKRGTEKKHLFEEDFVNNLRMLQAGFKAVGIKRSIPIAEISKDKTKTIFDFLNWFYDRFIKLLKAAWAKESAMYIAKMCAKPCLLPAEKALQAMQPIHESAGHAQSAMNKFARQVFEASKEPIRTSKLATEAVLAIIPIVKKIEPPAQVLKQKVEQSCNEQDVQKMVKKAEIACTKVPPVMKVAAAVPPVSKHAVEASKKAKNSNHFAFETLLSPREEAVSAVNDLASKAPGGIKPTAAVVPLASRFQIAGQTVLICGEALELLENGQASQGNSKLTQGEKILEETFKLKRTPEGKWLHEQFKV